MLVPVLANHRFDEAALARYLAGKLPGFAHGCTVLQFQGGQSNPTYHVQTDAGAYVLRRKPAGPVLPSAHAVDREYRILTALQGTGVPVPPVRLFCADPAVIGTIFFVMDYVEGRVFADRSLPGVTPLHRRAVFDDMARVLAALHRLDPGAVGLGDYGRRGAYVGRQLARWTMQYEAARLDPEPAMDALLAWLHAHPAVADETTIVHGDYRLGNLMLHPTEPRIVGVLDWELSTLGHPLADLAYCALPWHLPPALQGVAGLTVPGLPSEADFLADYCRHAGRKDAPDMVFFVAFSLFRWAAIVAGVYRRALDGTAADAGARAAGEKFRALAAAGRAVALGETVTA
ncbi:MAG: phosphotransferase [Acetobacteraceae bacterium]